MGWDDYSANGDAYDYAAFTVNSGVTDYDLKANQAALWKNIQNAKGIVIICDQTFGIKLNSTLLPMITVTAVQAPWEFINKKLIRNGYLSNSSGSLMNVEVLLL